MRSFWLYGALCVAIQGLSGCGSNPVAETKTEVTHSTKVAQYDRLVVAFGDSLYAGYGVLRVHDTAAGTGARYTRAHPPARLLASFEHPDRSSALKAEVAIKRLKPAQKRLALSFKPSPV